MSVEGESFAHTLPQSEEEKYENNEAKIDVAQTPPRGPRGTPGTCHAKVDGERVGETTPTEAKSSRSTQQPKGDQDQDWARSAQRHKVIRSRLRR